MTVEKCPNCECLIPEYRLDDPYCDCGWQLNDVVSIQDDLGWIIAIISAALVSVLQVFILFVIHIISNYSLSILASIAASFLSFEAITFLHYFIVMAIDFFFLAILYSVVCYWMVSKSDSPIMLTTIFGLIVVPVKLFLIDPKCNIPYPLMVYLFNLMLLVLTIMWGVFAKPIRSKVKKLCLDTKQSFKFIN